MSDIRKRPIGEREKLCHNAGIIQKWFFAATEYDNAYKYTYIG